MRHVVSRHHEPLSEPVLLILPHQFVEHLIGGLPVSRPRGACECTRKSACGGCKKRSSGYRAHGLFKSQALLIANQARSDKAANSFNRKYVKGAKAQPQFLMSLARLQVSLVLRFIVR